jgi:hypothetical protein
VARQEKIFEDIAATPTTVSIEVSGSRPGHAIFIIGRIGEPEHHVVQIRMDPSDVVEGKVSSMMASTWTDLARRIRGEVPIY